MPTNTFAANARNFNDLTPLLANNATALLLLKQKANKLLANLEKEPGNFGVEEYDGERDNTKQVRYLLHGTGVALNYLGMDACRC